MKHNIYLAFEFAKNDLKERYIGTSLGHIWYVLSPIITIFIYTIIFSDFMKMKLNVVSSDYAYSIYLISGLLAWTSFSTIIMRLSNFIIDKSNLIKKISLPTYIYALSIMFTEFFMLLVAYIIALLFLLLINYHIDFTFLYLLPILFLQTLFAFAIGVILSLFTPFFKDLKEIVPIVMQLWFWMTPIIYLKDAIMHKYPLLITINPFYYFLHLYHNIFLYAKAPTWSDITIITSMTLFSLIVAAYLYKKMMPTIKDII